MKRLLLWGVAALLLLGRIEHPGTDVAKLLPVQVLYVTQEQGRVQIQTDLELSGTGDTVAAAMDQIRLNASGEVFLDTTDYLLLSEEAEVLLPELMPYLRPSCGLCLTQGEPNLTDAAAYLKQHPPAIDLKEWQAGERKLPILAEQEGELELVE